MEVFGFDDGGGEGEGEGVRVRGAGFGGGGTLLVLLGCLGGEGDFRDGLVGDGLEGCFGWGVGGEFLEGEFEAVLRGGGAEVGEGALGC